MREFKFRAWDGLRMTTSGIMYNTSLGTLETPKIGVFELMQFTGFLDKNGKEIYEGDIITYKRSIGNWTGQYMTTTHKIVFSEEVFAFVMEYGNQYIKLRKHWGYEYEVIGNIYENSEIELKN